MTVYGPRVHVHEDRFGARKSGPNRLLVIHTSEGAEGPTAAENLGTFMTLPGDRPSSTGGKYGASYHYVTDTDRVLPAVPDGVVSFSATGANSDGIHICIPGKAGQTRAQWLDTTSRSYIRQAAGVMVDKAFEHNIWLTRLTPAQIVAGGRGYCGHVDINNAYHQTDHTDPGAQFPWDVLAADIAALTTPPPAPSGDDMELHRDPPRIYSTDPADHALTTDPAGAFLAGQVRKIKIPLTGLRQARIQVTVRPIDSAGFLRVGPGDADLTRQVHSNVNWGLAQPESSPVEVLLDGNGDTFAIYANANCHVIVDWLGWLA